MKIEQELFEATPDFPREIGYFLSGLEDVRQQWREAVRGLSKKQLAAKILPDVQPIGSIILHIGEAEYYWIQMIVAGKELDDETKKLIHWDIWFDDFASKDLDADYCIEAVEKIHGWTRQILAGFTDDDLDRFFTRASKDKKSAHNLRWILHHLIDHEATHKGQILMIKRLLG